MPNLVGTGLNQVPTNSMLGGLAYQSPDHASIKDLDLKNLSQINSEIANTAVDIFIYDTSKDSDGGAWRKRTKHTSWYNETLNTVTRGSRREFPAVAVLVLQGTVFTIYDGDDPDLPMWMVFNKASNSYFSVTTNSCVTALNGKIVSGGNASNDRLRVIDFLLDNEVEYSHTAGRRTHLSPISGRNGTVGFTAYDTSLPGIVNRYVNDVAMTVLPNASIDDATGLPVPTIAVATNRGVSVIRDDGILVDLEHNGGTHETCRNIAFSEDKTKVLFTSDFNDDPTYNRRVIVEDIPSGDSTFTVVQDDSYQIAVGGYDNNGPRILGTSNGSSAVGGIDHLLSQAVATSEGVTLLDNELDNILKSKVAYITSDYNTGWMVGDIKGAFLSDTDDTNVTGTELWPEGDFADANEWSSAAAQWTISGGTATVNYTGGGYSFLGSSTGTLTNGKKYVLSFTISNYGAGGRLEASQSNSGNIPIGFSANGTYSQIINYTGTTGNGLGMYAYGGGTVNFTLDNLHLRELEEEDRSFNDTGLAVYGTVTKSAVATGAELVGYSGFSGSNVLVQPYNSDLNPGTGDYSFMCWFKCSPVSGEQMLMRRFGVPTVTGGMMLRIVQSSSVLQWYVRDTSSSAATVQSPSAVDDGNWHCAVGTRQGSTANLYLDGVLVTTQTCSANSHDPGTTADLVIGAEESTANPGTYQNPADLCSLTLVRYSRSAPSATQVKKMYEDEKKLFQENVACTLYGSSDAVTALAYDDSTNLLYAGTSSGRSEFQGLRRINNTTTAVTTAISASNGLVAEQ